MLTTQGRLRVLGPDDLTQVAGLLAHDPVVNVIVSHRAQVTRMEPRWLGGEMWGYFDGDRLLSVCHSAANLIPAMADEEALDHFAARALRQSRRCSTIVGPSQQVESMWTRLRHAWPEPRDVRLAQPHLEIDHPPLVDFDPLVRRSRPADLDILYPAAVAMYTEEVGLSPEDGGGGPAYRARTAQLIERGWSFIRVDDGEVVFKAEVAAVSPEACQIQGVYVAPHRRGEGLGVAGMAAVVDLCLRDVAPVVALYVNAHNDVARRVYEKVGFRQTATFSTILF